MTATAAPRTMPELPHPGQKVRWRYPEDARRCGWEAVFGPGPFEVVGLGGGRGQGLAESIVLRTAVGEREIPEVWLALDDEPQDAGGQCRWLDRS